ncbi:hypothetical protein KY289_000622 [Solanum tuberosum]|nr:hypothetical protein KY289_000622 [Solanum tuberosum]
MSPNSYSPRGRQLNRIFNGKHRRCPVDSLSPVSNRRRRESPENTHVAGRIKVEAPTTLSTMESHGAGIRRVMVLAFCAGAEL